MIVNSCFFFSHSVVLRCQVCVASGKIVGDSQWLRCKACKHPMIEAELNGSSTCPLCHALLPSKISRRGASASVGGR